MKTFFEIWYWIGCIYLTWLFIGMADTLKEINDSLSSMPEDMEYIKGSLDGLYRLIDKKSRKVRRGVRNKNS